MKKNEINLGEMHEIARRFLEIINKQSISVTEFAETIGISQQKMNRIFNLDKRTNKYPVPTTEMLVNINWTYINIDPDWLLTGRGKMYRASNFDKAKQLFPNYKPTGNRLIENENKIVVFRQEVSDKNKQKDCIELQKIILSQQKENGRLNREIGKLEYELSLIKKSKVQEQSPISEPVKLSSKDH